MNREAIRQALFDLIGTAKINGKQAWTTADTRLGLWDKYPADNCPAYTLAAFEETYIPNPAGKAVPPKVEILTTIFIYTTCQNPDTIPDTQVNELLDALDPLFFLSNSINGYVQTLGGLVDWCRIEGKVNKAPGYIDGVGLTRVPIKMLVPV